MGTESQLLIRYANVALRHLELCTLPSRDVSAPVKKNKTKHVSASESRAAAAVLIRRRNGTQQTTWQKSFVVLQHSGGLIRKWCAA